MLHGQGSDAAGFARLRSVVTECERFGAKVAFSTGDLAKAGTASRLVGAAREKFASIDAIVHAAGFADRRGFKELPRESLERAFAVMAASFHEMTSAALEEIGRAHV